MLRLTEKELKILNKAVNEATPEDEASNAAALLVKSVRGRGVKHLDMGNDAGGAQTSPVGTPAKPPTAAVAPTPFGTVGAQPSPHAAPVQPATDDPVKIFLMYGTLAALAVGLWWWPHGTPATPAPRAVLVAPPHQRQN